MGLAADLGVLLTKLLKQEGCFWSPLTLSAGAAGKVRKRCRRAHFLRSASPRLILKNLTLLATWPIRLALQIHRYLRLFGEDVRLQHAVPRARQIFEMAYLGLLFGVPACSYYQYRLFLPTHKNRLNTYLYPNESLRLLGFLNDAAGDLAVDDKIEFARRCQASGLSHNPTLVQAVAGRLHILADDWGADGVIAKPATGHQGIGVELFRANPDGSYQHQSTIDLSRSDVLAWLKKASEKGPYLLQRRLINHPDLSHLSSGSLVTVRAISRKGDHGQPTVIAAILQMPCQFRLTNNNGLAAAIDLASGCIGKAYSYRPLHPGVDHHPDTGGKISGTCVPYWNDLVRLVVEAHGRFTQHYSLGWDVALTPEGPVLVETNAGWDVVMPQIAASRGLAEDLCQAH